MQSEMAYSETKGLLDQAEKKAEQLRKECKLLYNTHCGWDLWERGRGAAV